MLLWFKLPLLFCVDFSYFAVRMCNIAAAFFQYFVCKRVACSQFLDFFQAFSIDSDIFSISFYYFLSIFCCFCFVYVWQAETVAVVLPFSNLTILFYIYLCV